MDLMASDLEFKMVAKTLSGLEDVLEQELIRLGAKEVEQGRRMVSFVGNKELLYRANFQCRTALRILKPIAEFKASNADEVYQAVKNIRWEKYLDPDQTFAIDPVVYSETFTHARFVAYKTKDAIVDYFVDLGEKRPSVRINNPDVLINVHISHKDCTISMDSSGESLHKRGYRKTQTEAPLNEVLAAGMILKTGWRGESNFVDPMCGSGTLLIEAALIALNIAPGVYRQHFAFERWADFDKELLEMIYNDESGERPFNYRIYGSDISKEAIAKAEENVKSAGLSSYVDLQVLPFQQYEEVPSPVILITNPPYGERLAPRNLEQLYTMIGERLKHCFSGSTAWILSYKKECFYHIGLKHSERIELMNGPLECEFRKYELFEGRHSDYKKGLAQKRKSFRNREERKEFFNQKKEEWKDKAPKGDTSYRKSKEKKAHSKRQKNSGFSSLKGKNNDNYSKKYTTNETFFSVIFSDYF